VTIMHSNNEVGTLQPVREVARQVQVIACIRVFVCACACGWAWGLLLVVRPLLPASLCRSPHRSSHSPPAPYLILQGLQRGQAAGHPRALGRRAVPRQGDKKMLMAVTMTMVVLTMTMTMR
jgi:hypothetical protein